MTTIRVGVLGLLLGTFCFGGCAVATDDAGPGEPTVSEGEGLSCAVMLCIEGTVCVEHGKTAKCVKPKRDRATNDPCATLKCMAGYTCVASEGVASCVNNCDLPGACGPALLMPNTLCDDGVTVAGPTGNCLDYGGQCGWEVISCP